ncbi:MAG: hypothetical protein RLZZ500_2581 [Bacteroidota bacterium]
MTILLRTCGGIGNQLFQSNFALILAAKFGGVNIYHLHSSNYKRVAHWELESLNFLPARNFYFLLLVLRIPRVLTYSKIRKKDFVRIGNVIIADGYFLEKSNYSLFSRNDIDENLKYLRSLIGIKKRIVKKTLVHIRLGDFFTSNKEKDTFIYHFLGKIDERVDIITNEEDLLIECINNEYIHRAEKYNIISTTNLSSIELLRFICQYDNIWYNGSTLLFWGAVLGTSSLNWSLDFPKEHYIVRNCIYLDDIMKIFREG